MVCDGQNVYLRRPADASRLHDRCRHARPLSEPDGWQSKGISDSHYPQTLRQYQFVKERQRLRPCLKQGSCTRSATTTGRLFLAGSLIRRDFRQNKDCSRIALSQRTRQREQERANSRQR